MDATIILVSELQLLEKKKGVTFYFGIRATVKLLEKKRGVTKTTSPSPHTSKNGHVWPIYLYSNI